MYSIGIDLGSNSLGIVKVDCKLKRELASSSKIVRLAQGLVDSGYISKEATSRVIKAIEEIKKEIDFNDSKIEAVSTEAMRQAKNSSKVIEEIKEATDIEFKIIDGKQEAQLTVFAAQKRLDILNIDYKNLLLLDIGGGSSELTYIIDNKIISKSFKIGIVTITESSNSLEDIERNLKDKMREVVAFIKTINKNSKIDIMVSTAGTPTTLAALKHNLDYSSYNADLVNGTTIYLNELDDMLAMLLNLDETIREKLVGVGRGDLIFAGILIFKEFFKAVKFKSSIVVDDSLREGIAYMQCN